MEALVARTRDGGGEIVKLLKSGSAFYAPAAGAVAMAASILNDERRLLPCACFLNGQYGFEGIYMGVAAILGTRGVEEIVELPLDTEARIGLQKTAGAIQADLLELRRTDDVFRAQRRGGVDGAVLGTEAFVLRYFGADGDDRLLLVNLGRDLRLVPAPEPLLAPPDGRRWRLAWSSEHPRYGGQGTPPIETEAGGWFLPGQAAVVMRPAAVEADDRA